jgi:hypothetical protein
MTKCDSGLMGTLANHGETGVAATQETMGMMTKCDSGLMGTLACLAQSSKE